MLLLKNIGFLESEIKDYEHILVKHVPKILQVIILNKLNFTRNLNLWENFHYKALNTKINFQKKIFRLAQVKEEENIQTGKNRF
jgi:hypothetical protein